ncbi:capsular biosynthesis protein [Sphingobium nicotianae]|uniref:Capsular biosynthesis protein n=1 Tax=Sphingobium nicotianae TaxID=2782607 RepID=A0A9X1DBJ4_9SPHN|nr:capsular biosynthesis protein [Sphingobium nicotianae]MBT2186934.1 capsular biosynthesis protein [Sphingobium nicotianae]
MAGQSAHRKPRSLIERAADHYDFRSALRGNAGDTVEPMPSAFEPIPAIEQPLPPFTPDIVPVPAPVVPLPTSFVPQVDAWSGIRHPIDREKLAQVGIIVPDSEATETSEEFRIVKRRILSAAFEEGHPKDRGNLVLVNSAHPNEGKTWCAINLAMSLAAEQDMDVLLVDGDFAKPGVCERLGLPEGTGFMDALVDPYLPIEQAVLRTDIPSLSVLPTGRHVTNDTEFVASERTRQVLDRLVAGHPRRIVILDSPPALAASVASELARHVGQTVLVVRADRTTEAALRDAVNLISACPNIRLLLNGVKFSSSGRQFGTYYGKTAS